MQKKCALCGQTFDCQASNISQCWCQQTAIAGTITLGQNSDCICKNCFGQSPQNTANIENYYYENGYMVFTAKYLKDRGYCCGNGCRHCPYK